MAQQNMECNLNIKENYGQLYVGDNIHVNHIRCHCPGNCHEALQKAISSQNASEREHVLPVLQLNSNDISVLSDVTNAIKPKVCLCVVYQQDNHIIVENSLSRFVTDLIRSNNCMHFEMQVKVKACRTCKSNNVEMTNVLQEFECTLTSPIANFDENRPLQLERVNSQPDSAFQAFLTKSQNIIQAEGNCIRIICKICENGKKVKIKLRFDVRSSVKRRSKSLSDFDFIKKQSKKPHEESTGSLRNINDNDNNANCLTKSNASLGKAQSAITILDGEVNIQPFQEYDHEKTESTLIMQETLVENTESQVNNDVDDQNDEADVVVETEEVDGFSLNVLEEQEVFATGKFGPLYKVSRKGREQLVKIVETDKESEHFLEEARQFLKCRHPYIRPTADIIQHRERHFVLYWFLDGHSLFQAIEDNVITDYVVYCRILFGMVKGLVYLEKIGIECMYLTPEKVLLDSRFNPRIAGVGKSYFKSQENTETNHVDFHRCLSYLDIHLRSKDEKHSKNVLWSVGRCIWEMLLRKICQKRDQEDLLAKYNFFAHLQDSCDDQTIKSAYFCEKLRKDVFGAGWPRDKEITKSLVVCAVRCMLINLEERMSLGALHNTLETELYELQRKLKFYLYETTDNLCLYCIKNVRDKLPLTCGCKRACTDCLRNNGPLDCPEHGMQYSKIGHPLTYAVIIQGEFSESESICDNDSVAMENILNDQNSFAIKNIESVKSKSQSETCEELKRLKTKIMGDKKAKDNDKYETTLLLYITGHCNDAGNLILSNGSILLNKKFLCEIISNINPKNLIVLVNGHYSEKLVKNLSKAQKNFFVTSRKFFGVFSHAGNMCEMSHKDISEEHSILVRFMLDILKKDVAAEVSPSSSSEVSKGYLTIAELTAEISKRMHEKFNKSLKPDDKCGGCIPIAYL